MRAVWGTATFDLVRTVFSLLRVCALPFVHRKCEKQRTQSKNRVCVFYWGRKTKYIHFIEIGESVGWNRIETDDGAKRAWKRTRIQFNVCTWFNSDPIGCTEMCAAESTDSIRSRGLNGLNDTKRAMWLQLQKKKVKKVWFLCWNFPLFRFRVIGDIFVKVHIVEFWSASAITCTNNLCYFTSIGRYSNI